MAFECVKASTSASRQLLLQPAHPRSSGTVPWGHNPRATLRLPQFIREAPSRPAYGVAAASADQEQYAAFALGNFYSDRKLPDLHGSTLWEKLQHWRATQPRGSLDRLAWRMLDNIQLRLDARSMMRVDAQAARVRRRLLRRGDAPHGTAREVRHLTLPNLLLITRNMHDAANVLLIYYNI